VKYDELLEKYLILEEENRILKEEIKQLKMRSVAESTTEFMYINTDAPTPIHQISSDYRITQSSSSHEKLSLYLSLFKGRSDVCAKKWKNKLGYSPYCYNDFKPGLCNKPKIKCSGCSNSNFAQLNHEQLKKHLLGEQVLGLYPMTTKDTCYLLAMDFDEATWKDDIAVVRRLCYVNNIPVYAERSRSGEGCHLWFFFEKEIKASVARKFGMSILDLAMQESGNIRFDSYDRLFPSQDFLQKDGFGNLIALPLQKEARLKNNSVFIDDALEEIKDQWQYLSQVVKISEEFIVAFAKTQNTVTALSEIINEDGKEREYQISKSDFPEALVLKRGKGIEINKQGITHRGLYFLRKMSSYANPEFYAKQAMRQSTFGTPRVTAVYIENEQYIVLPRGVELSLLNLLDHSGIRYSIIDKRFVGRPLDIKFLGMLNQDQEAAFCELNKYDEGVLSATTGYGKTVIGIKIIAEKSVPTLILVHTKELAVQWKDRLEQFLEINENIENRRRITSVIGQLGGGKNTLNGIVDIAIMQSMFEKNRDVKSLINQYGLIIVDECHHVSATNFSRILSAADSKYVYGLTATPIRKDGHHPIIFMQCGPIRHKVDAKQEAKKRDFDHFVVPRFTSARMPAFKKHDEWHITEIYQHICESSYRNELIVTDIEQTINAGRNPLVLTERTGHIGLLVEMMKGKDYEVIVLSGDLKPKIRKAALEKIRSLNDGDRFVLVATGKLIGEGFDEARLDTLFMAMPIAWKGTIAQYAGRLHRNYEGKEEVLIYDYVDVHIPVLERMYHKRLTAYRSVGYSIKAYTGGIDVESVIYDESDYFEHVISDIKNAGKNILVSSPFLQKKKIDSIKELLVEKYNSGVRITLCIKQIEDYSDKQRAYISKFISEILKQGINVIQVAQNRYKFMIIDNKIVWYGGVDIFGGSYDESSLIRIQNEELANELLGTISELS
jgi:superfamily II DNA or RNA helicase